MTKAFNITVIAALCAVGSAVSAGEVTQQPSPAFVNDMPFPSQMPTYTPRTVFADMPFMEIAAVEKSAVLFEDMPFPAAMQDYTPVRYFSDLPARAYDVAAPSDHALLQIDQ